MDKNKTTFNQSLVKNKANNIFFIISLDLYLFLVSVSF